ncbi:MAG: cation transporter [Saprospiraceae bacterium]|nr:cation transporter [Saprospiraceae bacterium]
MKKSIFRIAQMDCPSEENLIRLNLSEISGIKHLDFDLANRTLVVFHLENLAQIEKALIDLNLGSSLVSSDNTSQKSFNEESDQSKILWTILIINLAFFFVEMTTGIISKSMGLVADSLDMLADAFVYGISLMAVGSALSRKKRIAKIAGWFQIILAIIGFVEVIRRFITGGILPNFSAMIIVSIFALIANGICLYLLQQSRSMEEAHMKASMIFTSNDIIINLGVIIAGTLVYLTNTRFPDLLIGTIVFVLVIQGAFRILKLSK